MPAKKRTAAPKVSASAAVAVNGDVVAEPKKRARATKKTPAAQQVDDDIRPTENGKLSAEAPATAAKKSRKDPAELPAPKVAPKARAKKAAVAPETREPVEEPAEEPSAKDVVDEPVAAAKVAPKSRAKKAAAAPRKKPPVSEPVEATEPSATASPVPSKAPKSRAKKTAAAPDVATTPQDEAPPAAKKSRQDSDSSPAPKKAPKSRAKKATNATEDKGASAAKNSPIAAPKARAKKTAAAAVQPTVSEPIDAAASPAAKKPMKDSPAPKLAPKSRAKKPVAAPEPTGDVAEESTAPVIAAKVAPKSRPKKAAASPRKVAPETAEADAPAAAKKSRKAAHGSPVAKVAPKARAKKAAAAPRKGKTSAPAVPTDEETGSDENSQEEDAGMVTVAAKKPRLNNIVTDHAANCYDLPADKPYNLKISTWNVAGLRALCKKDGMAYVDAQKPDIFCMQEIKCLADEVPAEARPKGYHLYWNARPGGHAGVALFSKTMPYNLYYGFDEKSGQDNPDGRLITAEYLKFYVVAVYVPNAGRKLVNLAQRLEWNEQFLQHVRRLNEHKPVIVCGDLNVSHRAVDLANPKSNTRSAGFTEEERAGMDDLLREAGLVDTFRQLYPDRVGAYTYWTYMSKARDRNVGWRLDYFLTSQRIVDKVVDNVICSDVLGSDHCPITLFLQI